MKPKYMKFRETPNSCTRIYFLEREDLNGFDYEIWEWQHGPIDVDEDDWLHPGVEIKRIGHGNAYFDGIRHFYLENIGTNPDVDNYGISYMNYPDLRIFQTLIDLEREYCRYGDSSGKDW